MRKPLPRPRAPRPLALLLLLPAFAGCGGQGTISGRVTLNDQPLPLGTITFHSQDGRHDVFNAPVRDGAYSIDGVPTGDAWVTVVAPPPAAGGRERPREGGADAAALPRSARRGQASPGPVPPRYGNPEQSGLSLRVAPGSQQYNVDLKP
jgi:hypothetical protein